MAWDSEVKELERRRHGQTAREVQRVARQHAKGRMTIRERVDVFGPR